MQFKCIRFQMLISCFEERQKKRLIYIQTTLKISAYVRQMSSTPLGWRVSTMFVTLNEAKRWCRKHKKPLKFRLFLLHCHLFVPYTVGFFFFFFSRKRENHHAPHRFKWYEENERSLCMNNGKMILNCIPSSLYTIHYLHHLLTSHHCWLLDCLLFHFISYNIIQWNPTRRIEWLCNNVIITFHC